MTPEQCAHAVALDREARTLKKKIDTYVLLRRDALVKEVVCLGDPVQYRSGEYFRVEVPVPEEIRRHAFNLWRRDMAKRYNAMVRELAQLGINTDLELMKFSPSTGLCHDN